MKFSLIAVAAAHLTKLVDASPIQSSTDEVDEVNGWWEEEATEIEERSTHGGDKFTLPQVKNTNYKKPPANVALLKTFYKYNVEPPQSLVDAPQIKVNLKGKLFGQAEAKPTKDYDSEYVIPVSMGTPSQLTYLNLDTGSGDLWTFTTDTPKSMSAGHIIYNPKRSSTSSLVKGQTWSILYGDGSTASGNVYRDVVQIGGTIVYKQAIESATSVSDSIQDDTFSHGILGMSFSSLNSVVPTRQKTYFQKVQHRLAKPVFTANLKKQQIGTYGFGFINQSEYTGSIYYQTSISEDFWQVQLNGYKIGTTGYKSYQWSAIIDTGTTLLLTPQHIVTKYYSKVANATLDEDLGVMVFPCDSKLPDFYFGMGPYRGYVPGNYINYGDMGDGTCYGGIQASTGLPFSILGDILLKAQFVVLNIKNQTIGFANKPTISA